MAGTAITTYTFSAGATLSSTADIITDGSYLYSWTGTYPKVVAASTTATSTGGIGLGGWSILGDAVLRSNLSSTSDSLGDALIGVKQPYDGAVARNQSDKNAESISLMDAGAERDGFDIASVETAVKSIANEQRLPYLGAKQFAFPKLTLKSWSWLDGFQDRAVVASFTNLTTPDGGEPVTQVLGISSAAELGSYSDRDFVLMFGQIEGPQALLSTSKTTFTANTITSSDITPISTFLRAGQIIDVTDASNSSLTYSGLILSLSDTTVTVDTAWYLKDGNGSTGIPTAASVAVFIPNTKIWGQNVNVIIDANSEATSLVGYELGMQNNKVDGYIGYGFDCVNLGTYGIGYGFQTRGDFNVGFAANTGIQYGFVSYDATGSGYYSSSDHIGAILSNNTYGLQITGATSYPLIIQDSNSNFLTGINATGAVESLRYAETNVDIGGTVGSYGTVNFATPTVSGDSINLPTSSSGRVIYIRNLSGTIALSLVGPIDPNVNGGKNISLAAATTIQLYSDGNYWYPMSQT